MTRIQGVWHWQQIVSTYLPCLSRPQVATLALWSLGIVLMQSAGLTTVTACIALLLGQAEPTVRERLRSWYRAHKRARKRTRKEMVHSYRVCSRSNSLVIPIPTSIPDVAQGCYWATDAPMAVRPTASPGSHQVVSIWPFSAQAAMAPARRGCLTMPAASSAE